MSSFICSVDFGSTNVKILLMEVNNDIINIKNKNIFLKNDNVENELFDFINKNISIRDLEVIVVTGAGSFKFFEKDESIDTKKGFRYITHKKGSLDEANIKVIRVDEFEAISIGGVVIGKVDKGIVANIGTGTSFVYGELATHEYLGGTGLGGGTFLGLAKNFVIDTEINEIFDMADSGNFKNVDLLISDISKNKIANLSLDITAANFAKNNKNIDKKDILAGFINMITQNIGLQLSLVKKNFLLRNNLGDTTVILTGGFLNYEVVKKYFNLISKFTNVEYKYVDEEYSQYATCIGAYEYYLMKIRENHKGIF